MTRIIFENILQLIIVFPIIVLSLKNRKTETIKILLAFVLFFLLNQVLLYLPIEYEVTKTGSWNTNWNWTGKIYATIGSILFLVFYRKFELKDYFLTFKQNTEFIRKGILIISGILTIQIIIGYFFNSQKDWNLDTLFFQFSMPGINEEIAYRGIMLGLLTKSLKDKVFFFNPAILITAILFGLAHGFFLTESYGIRIEAGSFIWTFVYGIIWGWITLKSGSILLALISHNLGNGIGQLIRMR